MLNLFHFNIIKKLKYKLFMIKKKRFVFELIAKEITRC